MLSPGPGIPQDAGITEQVIRELKGETPMLGICLGHQAIGEVFGAKVVRAKEIIHGKTSPLRHNGKGLYEGVPQDIPIGRYHSLILDRETLPDCLAITSDLADGTIMGVRHKAKNIEGIAGRPRAHEKFPQADPGVMPGGMGAH